MIYIFAALMLGATLLAWACCAVGGAADDAMAQLQARAHALNQSRSNLSKGGDKTAFNHDDGVAR